MKTSWNWLRDLVELHVDPHRAAERLTFAGLEVESVAERGAGFSGVVVAEVKAKRPHPTSAKLTLVTIGQGVEVVCGAPNVPEPGRKVLWAQPGAHLPDGRSIAARTIAGVSSPGMLCSEAELGIGEDASGIVVLLGEDADAPPGTPGQDALGLRDFVLDVNVTANRGDCLSHLGIARELAALFAGRVRPPDAALEAVAGDGAVDVTVEVEDPVGCPRYTARVIEGLTVRPSPRWMRRRLEAVGVRPISNLVDVTNYVLFELGQPLHAFDLAEVRGRRIVVRRARPGERLTTLDDKERVLEPGDLLICDAQRIVGLAGVMGGAGSEIGAATRGVLLEAASFEPRAVRRTAKRLALHTEAAHRFERGVDPAGVDFASARAARLLAELGGGKVRRGVADVYPAPVAPRVLSLRPARARALLGLELQTADIVGHLRALSLEVAEVPGALRVTCPTYRQDLEREVDLVEEVARMHGFEDVPATLPPTNQAPRPSGNPRAETVRDTLAAAGLDESIGFGFTSRARLQALRFPEGTPATRPVVVQNPMRDEQEVMRTSLLANLLSQLAHNLAFGQEDVRLFEAGSVFLPSGQALPAEPTFVAGVLAGNRPGWLQPAGPVDFFYAKGILERLFAALRIPVAMVPARNEQAWWHPGVAAALRVGETHIGVVGEVHPETRDAFEIAVPCFAFEINLDDVPAAGPAQLTPIRRVPAVVRDVSFFVDESVPAARVRALIDEDRPAILEEIRLLEDYREPGKVPTGKKGMLWSMTYRGEARTLTDAEVDAAHEALVSRLLAALRAERR
jgi:phenylalanyl-tRNA synthetase beta chain